MAAPGAAGAAGRGLQALHSQQKHKQVPVATLWVSITLGDTSAQQKQIQGAAGSRRLQFVTWKKLYGWCHTEEQQSHVPTLPLPPGPRAPAQAPEESSQKQTPSTPKAVSIFPWERSPAAPAQCPQPLLSPQQLQLLSQACPGVEMCSWHRNSNPEPAFGHQPWVCFKSLEKSPATSCSPSLPSSAHLPGEAQAAAPGTSASHIGPKFTTASARVINSIHCSAPLRRQQKSSVSKQILNRVLCPLCHQPGEVRKK